MGAKQLNILAEISSVSVFLHKVHCYVSYIDHMSVCTELGNFYKHTGFFS